MELRDRWFDDYAVGESFEVAASHVMEAERMMAFAREFDPQTFHVDPEAAAGTIYGGLIASGWQTCGIAMRLAVQAALEGSESFASPGLAHLRWPHPVRAGDALRLRITVLDQVPSRSKPDRGALTCRNELHDQTGRVVLSLEATMLLLKRPEPG